MTIGLLVMVFALGTAAPQSIYRCPGSAGETLFSDRPCEGGRLQSTQPVITFDPPHFGVDERAPPERTNRAREAARGATPRAKASANATASGRCEAAREALDRVRATKRRGYRASSAAALDARERRYEAQRDRFCAR